MAIDSPCTKPTEHDHDQETDAFNDVLCFGDTSRFTTPGHVHKVNRIARERPGDLTDDEIKLLSEYGREWAADAFDRRERARAAAAAQPPPPAPAPAPSVQIARWLKGETEEQFTKRCARHAVSLSFFTKQMDGFTTVLIEQLNAMNDRNAERNVRLTSLETRLAAAEARLGGHNGSALDERLASIERAIAELQSRQALDGERIKQVEALPPALAYQGVFVPGRRYQRGQFATWGGSLWHANKTTTAKPGDGGGDWTLAVKRGADGRSAA